MLSALVQAWKDPASATQHCMTESAQTANMPGPSPAAGSPALQACGAQAAAASFLTQTVKKQKRNNSGAGEGKEGSVPPSSTQSTVLLPAQEPEELSGQDASPSQPASKRARTEDDAQPSTSTELGVHGDEEASHASARQAEGWGLDGQADDGQQQQQSGSVFSPVFQLLQRPLGQEEGGQGGPAQEALVPGSAAASEQQPGDCTQSLEAPVQLVHHHEHHIPEAVEHELPPDAGAEEVDEDEYIDFDPLLFIKSLPPLEEVIPRFRTTILPRKTRQCKQKTLVLDLDETLVHSSLEAVANSDFTFPVHFNNQEHMIHVRQRPHLIQFMERVSELFEVVVFTASQKIYAEKLLNIIDPQRKYVKHRIYRESCVVVDGNYLKDLTVLGRDLRTTFIIDNSPQAFGFQVDNGIPIESWYDDSSDTELLKMLPFLESLVEVDDVRPHISRKFRMRELIARAC